MPKNPFSNWTIQQVEAFNTKTVTGRLSSELAKERTPTKEVHDMSLETSVRFAKKKRKPAYTPEQVMAWCKQHGLPEPVFELKFHPERMWRFDIAWASTKCLAEYQLPIIVDSKVAIEIQGGIWITGGHSRGAQMKKDWEKWMEAQRMGWKMAWCEPKDLLTKQTADIIRGLLNS